MRDKIISLFLGIILGGVIFYTYTYFFVNDNSTQSGFTQQTGVSGRPNMDVSNMSDEQLESMAQRVGITKDELKQKLDSGEDIRTIMGNSGGRNRNNSGSGKTLNQNDL